MMTPRIPHRDLASVELANQGHKIMTSSLTPMMFPVTPPSANSAARRLIQLQIHLGPEAFLGFLQDC